MMNNQTRNEVYIRGFVGRYIRLPSGRGDPARFDVLTVEYLKDGDRGETATVKDWHTIKTWDIDVVREDIHSGALVEVRGRMDTVQLDGVKGVEISTNDIRVLLTQDQRDMLRMRDE